MDDAAKRGRQVSFRGLLETSGNPASAGFFYGRAVRIQASIEKNFIDNFPLLSTGQVSAQFVEKLITRSNGAQYKSSPHHRVPSVDVHIIESGGWYVKFYFVGNPETVFISVHP
ncbi:hypothetical protein LFL96_19180 [Paraburkholderia sp. D15]|uniref:hypothetical protein n=1 Tax=Paraburkholderia sp. D15 TaxID=2880218 RepID=UPI00247B0ED9|nr:hypothetical protein [Paraburkholderia sp. D15]WGS49843.1 hypothetical protein LFL96_19180 [Paraburkholderia sp. D15]